MLREIINGKIRQDRAFTIRNRKVYFFETPEIRFPGQYRGWSQEEFEKIKDHQQSSPHKLGADPTGQKTYWMFKEKFYWENEGYSDTEVKALLLERETKKEKRIERAIHKLERQQKNSPPIRERIPEDIQIFVWRRDQGRCVKCGSNERLEFDHIIPLSKGGSNSARNLQLLCQNCNREKGNRIG